MMIAGVSAPVAVIGIAEKGYVTVGTHGREAIDAAGTRLRSAFSPPQSCDCHVSLLGDADHRHRSRHAGDQSISERAAFVQHELGMDVAGREQLRDAGRAAPPAHSSS